MEFGNLQKLHELDLAHNELTGSVPHNIFNMSALQNIDFGENKLSGTLPSDLGRGRTKCLYGSSVFLYLL